VEIPAGKSGAIGRQQQVGIPEEPGLRIEQMKLNRELPQFRTS
jgi:hypothetical protein